MVSRHGGMVARGAAFVVLVGGCGGFDGELAVESTLGCGTSGWVCDPNASCVESGGQKSCQCNAGYRGNGAACSEVDECAEATAGCDPHARCTNTEGSYTCQCDDGYTGDGRTCTIVDLCASASCDPNATCSVSENTAVCACKSGFEGTGQVCEDIDECLSNAAGCATHAECTNTPGSFTCTCVAGYAGDGFGCDDIDECRWQTHDCDPNAVCTNQVGSYTCACEKGFEGDGRQCEDVDECKNGTAKCGEHASCNNSEGSFSCVCESGYVGDGFKCALPGCGNGIVESDTEACDDGNTTFGDGCRGDCRSREACGDGFVEPDREECDDGDDSDPNDVCHECTLQRVEQTWLSSIDGGSPFQPGGQHSIAMDAAGRVYVASTWGDELAVRSSGNLGRTWSVPTKFFMGASIISGAIAGGPPGVVYVVGNRTTYPLEFFRSVDAGKTWETQELAPGTGRFQVSLASIADEVYVGVLSSGTKLFRNSHRGAPGSWSVTEILNYSGPVLADIQTGLLISVRGDSTTIRMSSDRGVTFGTESVLSQSLGDPSWVSAGGLLFSAAYAGVVGVAELTDLSKTASAQLPSLSDFPRDFKVDADSSGNAYVVWTSDRSMIHLVRMTYQSGNLVMGEPRLLDSAGFAPDVLALPNGRGAIVTMFDSHFLKSTTQLY